VSSSTVNVPSVPSCPIPVLSCPHPLLPIPRSRSRSRSHSRPHPHRPHPHPPHPSVESLPGPVPSLSVPLLLPFPSSLFPSRPLSPSPPTCGGSGVQRHHVIGEQRILDEIRPVDENKDQVEAGEEGGTQLQILRHCLGPIVVATNRVSRRQNRRPR
jgi:hypothetical protein